MKCIVYLVQLCGNVSVHISNVIMYSNGSPTYCFNSAMCNSITVRQMQCCDLWDKPTSYGTIFWPHIMSTLKSTLQTHCPIVLFWLCNWCAMVPFWMLHSCIWNLTHFNRAIERATRQKAESCSVVWITTWGVQKARTPQLSLPGTAVI